MLSAQCTGYWGHDMIEYKVTTRRNRTIAVVYSIEAAEYLALQGRKGIGREIWRKLDGHWIHYRTLGA